MQKQKNSLSLAILRLIIFIKKIIFSGATNYCPLCNSSVRKFYNFGIAPRTNALCPVCMSLERHRMDCLFIKNETNLFNGTPKKLLHVAPEPSLEKLFKSVTLLDYLSADLFNPAAMVKMDITDIHFPDKTFDVIYCSHVLEHVPDDHKGISEFYRVLKPGGWAILQVPVVADKTYEDLSITSPDERIKVFGHPEHVRNYGPDYKERLINAGIHVDVITAYKLIDTNNLFRYGITPEEVVYYCTKQ